MSNEKLFQAGEPTFYLWVGDPFNFDNFGMQLAASHKEVVVRRIRGWKSRATHEFFAEISAALQFPYYFEESWVAFEELVRDLGWLSGSAYLLLVSDAPFLLFDEKAEFRLLLGILNAAQSALHPAPFHVVFQCEAKDLSAFSNQLGESGVKFENLH
jgi:hypothetical protein